MPIFFKYKQFKVFFNKRENGFTLIELLVVMTIATLLTTAVIFQNKKWNDSLIVHSAAYDTALVIRKTQIDSLGVREDKPKTGDKFDVGYGVYFVRSGLSVDLSLYIIFADRNKNGIYDTGEALETKIMQNGIVIDKVCGVSFCLPESGPLNSVHISFFRPSTSANISFLNGGGNPVDSPPVTIHFRSPLGEISKVVVETSGQISVQQ